ncbi:MAG: AmmeMemoRadiSam system protein B [Candidatus Thorarchaeota archaeon]
MNIIIRYHDDSFWYENQKENLIQQIKWCNTHEYGPNNYNLSEIGIDDPVGIVSPHAGFLCSGPYASLSFKALKQFAQEPDLFIIFGPNHTGEGSRYSIFPSPGSWETPLGSLSIDKDVSDQIKSEISEKHNIELKYDKNAHITEHSIDNQLPFLQYWFGSKHIVPICIMDQTYSNCVKIGETIGEIINNQKPNKHVLLIASSDFTHYVRHEKAKEQDLEVIKYLEKMDLETANQIKRQKNVSACGFGPIISLLSAAKKLGKTKSKCLAYGTSGMTCSSKNQVVGYASLIV